MSPQAHASNKTKTVSNTGAKALISVKVFPQHKGQVRCQIQPVVGGMGGLSRGCAWGVSLALSRAKENGGTTAGRETCSFCLTSAYAHTDSCDYTDNLFEGLPCSFETILSDSTQKTCLEYCNEEKPGTSCVRSWLQEIVADFGKNNCNQTYEQDANVVCVCANVGSCTLYADADISTEAVTGDTVSTHFRMDKRMHCRSG